LSIISRDGEANQFVGTWSAGCSQIPNNFKVSDITQRCAKIAEIVFAKSPYSAFHEFLISRVLIGMNAKECRNPLFSNNLVYTYLFSPGNLLIYHFASLLAIKSFVTPTTFSSDSNHGSNSACTLVWSSPSLVVEVLTVWRRAHSCTEDWFDNKEWCGFKVLP